MNEASERIELSKLSFAETPVSHFGNPPGPTEDGREIHPLAVNSSVLLFFDAVKHLVRDTYDCLVFNELECYG